jgi:DNA-binding GntR family transcriptional regulator
MRTITPQPSLANQVYDAILADITEGKFAPDGRLIQEELAESLGVSRQPVQQALLLLRNHGLLRDAPGRGLMVAPLDPDHVRDLFEIRGVLDGLASAKVAETAADAARKQGPAYIERGRAAVASGSIARMTVADMEFHFFLYKLSGNPLIAEICAPHWSYLRRVMAEVLTRGQTPQDIWNQHEAILSAIVAGKPTQAEQIARHHISHASEVLGQRLQQRLASERSRSARPRKRSELSTSK